MCPVPYTGILDPDSFFSGVRLFLISNSPLGAQYTMHGIQATIRTVNGQRLGSGPASFLDPFHLFKGKLRAAATTVQIPRFRRSALVG